MKWLQRKRPSPWLTGRLDSLVSPASDRRRAAMPWPPVGEEAASDVVDQRLADEYKMLMAIWDDFDRRALSIKGWMAGGSAAAIIASASSSMPWLAKAIVLDVVLFSIWYLEGTWKVFQHSFGPRINAIEDHFAGLYRLKHPFQSLDWSESVKQMRDMPSVWSEMCLPFVKLPYQPLMVAGPLIFLATDLWR